jgi:hypothetical protein
MSIAEILTMLALVAVVAYWMRAMQAKERARYEGRQRCQGLGLIFLDDTVVLKKLRLGRDSLGRLAFRRYYQFEFSSDGSQRYCGDITLLGYSLENITMDAYRVPEQSTDG